jgi:hypothetical protein
MKSLEKGKNRNAIWSTDLRRMCLYQLFSVTVPVGSAERETYLTFECVIIAQAAGKIAQSSI